MSTVEVRRYAPEHRPLVHLVEYEVPERDWLSTGTPLPPRLLVHPWQVEHVLDRYPQLKPTGATVAGRPPMSLRNPALRDEAGRHVKTAGALQMYLAGT